MADIFGCVSFGGFVARLFRFWCTCCNTSSHSPSCFCLSRVFFYFFIRRSPSAMPAVKSLETSVNFDVISSTVHANYTALGMVCVVFGWRANLATHTTLHASETHRTRDAEARDTSHDRRHIPHGVYIKAVAAERWPLFSIRIVDKCATATCLICSVEQVFCAVFFVSVFRSRLCVDFFLSPYFTYAYL